MVSMNEFALGEIFLRIANTIYRNYFQSQSVYNDYEQLKSAVHSLNDTGFFSFKSGNICQPAREREREREREILLKNRIFCQLLKKEKAYLYLKNC